MTDEPQVQVEETQTEEIKNTEVAPPRQPSEVSMRVNTEKTGVIDPIAWKQINGMGRI